MNSNFINPSHYMIKMLNSSQYPYSGQNTTNSSIKSELTDIVTEYTIHVDSKNRDIEIYPNPYTFNISLGGTPSYSSNKIKNKDGSYSSGIISGVPSPRIDLNFKNIKYFKLKYVMLPRNIIYEIDNTNLTPGNNYIVARTKSTILSNYRYLYVKIKELSNDKLYSTDDKKNDCFIIYRDSNYNDSISDMWFATQPIKYYYDNTLKNLSKLTLQILTPSNEELRIKYNDNTGQYFLNYNELNNQTVNSDFYNLYNEDIQTSMEFEIGINETQITKIY
jgi:hypothetical protein